MIKQYNATTRWTVRKCFEKYTDSCSSTMCTVNQLPICVSVLPSIAPHSPHCIVHRFVCVYIQTWVKLGQLWIGCYAVWRFYTSVNVLQWYKLLWIGCYAIWRFYTSVNVLLWYKLTLSKGIAINLCVNIIAVSVSYSKSTWNWQTFT